MHLLIIIATFAAFTVIVPLISWWRTRLVDNNDAKTYYLANRRLPWIQVAGALLLTNLSTEQLIGLNGAASIHGMNVMAWEIVPVFALVMMACYFLPRYWSGNITTVPEFLERRFDRTTRHLLGTVLVITLMFNFLPFVLYSGGVAMSSIFRVHEIFGVTESQSYIIMAWVIGIIGGCYVTLGGMKAVALSDTIYGVGLIVGALLIPVLGFFALGNGSFGDGVTRLFENQRELLNPIGGSSANVPFSSLFTGMLLINLFYWCTNQVIVQRSFSAASFAEAQKGVIATAGLKLIGPFFLVLPGIIAAEMFGAGIGNGDFAYAKLVETVLPTYLVGFFAAVLLGAIISSFNGGLHSASTLFSIDIYRSWLRPAAQEGEMLKAGKIFGIAVCLAAILVSGMLGGSADGVFTLMKRFMAAFNIPILSVVAIGMLTKRTPAWAAKTVLIAGVGTHFVLLWAFEGGRFGIKINWLHLAALNAALLCAFMMAAGRIAPAPVKAAAPADAEAEAAKPSIKPWRSVKAASAAVMIGAVLMYYLFWKFSQ